MCKWCLYIALLLLEVSANQLLEGTWLQRPVTLSLAFVAGIAMGNIIFNKGKSNE